MGDLALIARMPSKLVERLRKPEPAPMPPPPPRVVRSPPENETAAERAARLWEQERCRRYIDRAVLGEASDLGLTPEGGRNIALCNAARCMAQLVAGEPDLLREDDVRRALHQACLENGLIADHGEKCFDKTFASGFRYGLKRPRTVPPPSETKAPRRRDGGAHSAERKQRSDQKEALDRNPNTERGR